jgi:hypothetical protein
LSKHNYSYEKRQKELKKQRKKEEKLQRKLDRKNAQSGAVDAESPSPDLPDKE